MSGQSWEECEQLPGHVYLASSHMTVDGKDVWKFGVAFNGIRERMRSLNAKHMGLFGWEHVTSISHDRPAFIERIMARKLKALSVMVYRVDGIKVGNEVFATNDDTVGLRAMYQACKWDLCTQKDREADRALMAGNEAEYRRLRDEWRELVRTRDDVD
jgi:hypothetical protein